MGYEKVSVTSVHQCAGSPMAPSEPTQRVCNVTWAGARLADILAECEPRPTARFVWSTGADYGEFSGGSVEAYVKDLPINRVKSDALVAYEMNGAPLAPEHGFPARLVVPGFYGTNSVKWLTRMTLPEARAPGRRSNAGPQRSRRAPLRRVANANLRQADATPSIACP